MSRYRYVTLAQLERAHACSVYRELFQDLFGKKGKVKITVYTVSALAGAFNLYWAVDHLLTPKQQAVYQNYIQRSLRPFETVEKQLAIQHESVRTASVGHDIRISLRHAANQHYEHGVMGPAFAHAYNSPRK